LRRILEAASRRIDKLLREGGTFGPLTRQISMTSAPAFDQFSGKYSVLSGTDDIATMVSLAQVIPLDGWLV
ncbi:hypothetical protein ACVBEG_26900, partial [Pseudomonas sp. GG8]